MSEQCRAIIDGKEVVGWYFPILGGHCLMLKGANINYDALANRLWIGGCYFVNIDPATAAFDTGMKAKKQGKGDKLFPVFGSRGEFQGGDRIKRQLDDKLSVETDVTFMDGCWCLSSGGLLETLLCNPDTSELEIIPSN